MFVTNVRRVTVVRFLTVLLVIWNLTYGAFIASAQLTTAEEKGLPTNSVFSGGDVDVVNLQNGNLHISIPLASVAQRGGTTLKWAFVYDTLAWMKQWVQYPCQLKSCNPPGYYVPEANANVESGWRVVSPTSWTVSSTQSGIIDCQGPGFSYEQFTNFVVTDPEGAQHPLPLRDESMNCLGQTLAGPTLDGSGIYFDSQAGILYTKDGNQYTGGYSQTLRMGGFSNGQDTNGNQVSPTADTLNRDIVTTSNGTDPSGNPYVAYTINDSSGNPLVFRLEYQTVTIKTDICAATTSPYNCTDYTTTMNLPSVLTLPTGKTYVFKFAANTPGDLAEMDLPTGAVITYQYGDFYQAKFSSAQSKPNYVGSRAVTKRTVAVNGASNSWTYTPSPTGNADTVTDPLGNYEVHNFSTVSANGGPQLVYSTAVYEVSVSYYNSQQQLLRSTNNTYAADYDPVNITTANVRVIQSQTILDTGQTSQIQTDYETFTYPCNNGCTGVATRMNPTEKREYDYGANGPGALLRRTDYAYLHANNQSYVNLNIVDKPTTITVYDGNGNMAAQTVNEYDNYAHPNQPMQASGAIQHNSGYSTGYTTRGNVTAVSKWRNTDGAYVTATNQYDDAGNVLSTIDPLGHMTSYSFADSWAGNACVPSGTGAIYPTKVTNAKGQFATKTYYACTGTTGSTTDINGNTTSYTYDTYDRPWQVFFPDRGSKTFCYSDNPNGACYNASSLFSTETDAISGSTNLLETTLFDGLGRVQETQVNSDPNGTVYSDAQYDGDGRVYKVSNLYRSGDTEYWTTKLYDGIGRSAGTIAQDNASATSITYNGNTMLSTDEAGHQRKSQADALGRLTTVWEDPSGRNYETDYQYDVLGDLLQATQKGGDPNSADWRIRTFTYNSLGELLCSANPEIGSPLAAQATCPVTDTGTYIAGTVRYNYNNDGEVTSKIAPLPNQQGSATVTTSFSYEALHRVTNISYSDTTPSVSYTYDTDPITACTAPSLQATNGKGHMEAMCDASGATVWSYDTMGRTLTERRTIGIATDQVDYSYYLNGAIQTVTYPQSGGSSRYAVTYHENAAGRTDSATGSDGVVYAQVNSTWASGAPNQWQLGSNVKLVDTYNSLLQPLQTTATQISTSNTLLSKTYNFNLGSGDNGNLYGVLDGMDGLGLNRPNGTVNYTYDTLNRLSSAATLGQNCTAMNGGTKDWATTYTVDPWGNLTAKTPTLCQGESMATTTATNRNQLAAASYDSAGNLTQTGGAGYTYDAEGRMVSGMGAAYVLDGLSERVENTGSKLYWKGVGSTALMETNVNDQNPTMYIFFNGARIARIDPGA
ncbi:MAG: hypothetical protein WCC24_22655, partial [Terracidiphilus sp.]